MMLITQKRTVSHITVSSYVFTLMCSVLTVCLHSDVL